MTARARVDVDVVYQQGDATTITVGAMTEHVSPTIVSGQTITVTASTSAVTIVGSLPLSTLAVKNTGSSVLRLAGAIDVPAGRVAILPVTATITVSAPSGVGAYSCVWIG
jgi:uncharacterized protein with beta-barrel porin domain